ncbi:MAG: RecX family transcriptional regulator [bacterium]|nr:RecX family transcriptional regulator [bacterium]
MTKNPMKKRDNSWYVATMLLGVRPRSVAELFGRLSDKGFPLDEVQRTVDKCRELGYLNDREFAVGVCDQLLARKTMGKKKLYVKLRWFGLKEDLISEIMAEKLPPEKELEMAQYAGNKKKQQLIKRGTPKEKWYQKISQYLLGRGFSGEVVGTTVSGLLKMNDD